MKKRRQPTADPRAASANSRSRTIFQARRRIGAACAGAVISIIALDAAFSQESEGSSENTPQPFAEVLWQSKNSVTSRVPAVRVGEGEEFFFVCLRPADSPRAKPETLKYREQEVAIERLASDFRTGLCLMKLADEIAGAELDLPGIGLAPAGSWPAPGSAILAFDGKTDAAIDGKIAGRDLIYQGEEQPVTRLRVNLSPDSTIAGALLLTDLARKKLIGFLIPESLENRGEFHAVPAVFVSKLIHDFESGQKPSAGRFGASFDVGSTTPQIVSVRKDSAADRAGLKEGDVILQIGEWKISRLSDVIEVLRTLTPENSVEVEVLRGLQAVKVEVVPDVVKSSNDP